MFLAVLLPIVAVPPCLAQRRTDSLADFSLEELANIEITSVSKTPQSVSQAPASVFVITPEALRRSGVQTLPEALRLAPNLHVARISASQYAISTRGFNSTTSNKLLVLIDGRTVYTPLFSGVFWDAQDIPLGEVERIEVISGPGGTLWGTNAVNGVVNITTRPAQAASQGYWLTHAGNLQRGGSISRHAAAGNDAAYRLYAKFNEHDPGQRRSGTAVRDAWQRGQAGFRSDWSPLAGHLSLSGDLQVGRFELPGALQQRNEAAHLLARWDNAAIDGANWRVQGYVDYSHRDVQQSYREYLSVADIELQQSSRVDLVNSWVWGLGYREAHDRVDNTSTFAFLPARRTLRWGNVFGQYSHQLRPNLSAIVGARLEYNSYSDWELLPNVRLSWAHSDSHYFWSALSRAVRSPSRVDTDFRTPARPPFALSGNPEFASERVNTLAVGYRGQPSSELAVSLTVFASDYRRLRSLDATDAGAIVLGNGRRADVNGLEGWATWMLSSNWRIDAGVALLRQRHYQQQSAVDPEGRDPSAQWRLASHWSIADAHEVDLYLRRVGALSSSPVPAYYALDLRYAWRLANHQELSLSVFNLLDRNIFEFDTTASAGRPADPIEIPRSLQLSFKVPF